MCFATILIPRSRARFVPGATPSAIYFPIASDHWYNAPVMKIAERRASLGQSPVYLYYFRWESPLAR